MINKKRKREASEFTFYPYSKNKHLKEDLTDIIYNEQNSSKRQKYEEYDDQTKITKLLKSISPPFSNDSTKHFPYTRNEIINKKYKVSKYLNNLLFFIL